MTEQLKAKLSMENSPSEVIGALTARFHGGYFTQTPDGWVIVVDGHEVESPMGKQYKLMLSNDLLTLKSGKVIDTWTGENWRDLSLEDLVSLKGFLDSGRISAPTLISTR